MIFYNHLNFKWNIIYFTLHKFNNVPCKKIKICLERQARTSGLLSPINDACSLAHLSYPTRGQFYFILPSCALIVCLCTDTFIGIMQVETPCSQWQDVRQAACRRDATLERAILKCKALNASQRIAAFIWMVTLVFEKSSCRQEEPVNSGNWGMGVNFVR